MFQRFYLTLLVLSSCCSYSYAQIHPLKTTDSIAQIRWVDSLYAAMSVDQKVGQLFMAQGFSNEGRSHEQNIKQLVQKYHIGGIIFSKGGPVRQAKMNNRLQETADIPLMMAMDAEWGLSMRLDSTFAFPWNMTMGAVRNDTLIKRAGEQIGKHVKRIGMHMNFGPVVDINTNPLNPIIGNRSFGEEKENVTNKALAFMQGMHSQGVLSSAKHFPGHGDTSSDSHLTLPIIDFTADRIDSVELYPYRKLIEAGVSSVMVAHLNIPALGAGAQNPSSISPRIVTRLLQDKLNFKGLVFTDAMEMKGIADVKGPGEADLSAFMAGNDVILISENIPVGIEKIKTAVGTGIITEDRLARSVKKILMAKYKVGLHDYQPVDIENLYEELNTTQNDIIYRDIMENAITVLKNNNGILPIKRLDKQKIAYVSMGDDEGAPFFTELNKYAGVDWIKADKLNELTAKLKDYTQVIVGLHKSNDHPWKDFKFTNKELVWLYEISRLNATILSVFTRPYAMLDLKTTTNLNGIIIGYQNSLIAQQLTAQAIFGGIEAKGILPVSIGDEFPAGTSYITRANGRLSYGIPEQVGLNSAKLSKIDSVVNMAIAKKMTPGAQLLIAKKGKVVYHKSFGYHTYAKKSMVRKDDIYDLASLTKILATLPMLMQQHDQGLFTLEDPLKKLIPDLKNTNKGNIPIIRALSHTGRFKPWIPFYLKTLDSVTKKPLPKYYSSKYSKEFGVQVSEKLFLRSDYSDSLYHQVVESDLRKKSNYRYSDLPYYIFKKYIEDFYDASLAKVAARTYYEKLGAYRTTFKPLKQFKKVEIVPSERDTYFRYAKVQGYVHDMGAAMQNNVGGHAGLFSDAHGVAKMMQLYLNDGIYGDEQFFSKETMQAFNTCYYCEDKVRRGVGFDKPQLSEEGPTCGCVSMTSFGHSGFTGTFAWADPEEDLIYVFLSNRTYPTMENRALIKNDIRSKIQGMIYEAIEW
ncbi:glycoside hydrolase family 3 N-terminal domain-containing protein [Gangjinia marincola]|uniref:beta-N-acetylhexosaminidase n=1 Tax=Gangjinia marincola TaxID=578463 RepID=A0ABN1MDB6_9FLAO